MLTISIEKSVLIKGIVIIMMVFLHLFNGNHADMCENLFFIGEIPLAKWLSNACNPIDYFLVLSGYGLAYTYDYKGLSFIQQVKRIFKLYVHYWLILLIFVFLGMFIKPDFYPGSWDLFLSDFLGWTYTYNGEMWFLLPYCMVSLASSLIIFLAKRFGHLKFVFMMGVIYVMTCYIISRYGERCFYENMLMYRTLQFFLFLYPFSVGAVFYLADFNFNKVIPSLGVAISVIILVVFVASFGNSVVYMVYVPLMVILFCQMSFPRWIERILMELGRKSMPIWMIHTWYCYYLFQPQIYSLKYPILILGGAILVSYLTAIPVMWAAKKVFYIAKI